MTDITKIISEQYKQLPKDKIDSYEQKYKDSKAIFEKEKKYLNVNIILEHMKTSMERLKTKERRRRMIQRELKNKLQKNRKNKTLKKMKVVKMMNDNSYLIK